MTQHFRTIAEIPSFPVKLSYQAPSLWMGSCFTENIGGYLRELKFPVLVNPFGTLFNPLSIHENLSLLFEGRRFAGEDLGFSNGLYYSFCHHTSFSHPDRESCLAKVNETIENAKKFLSGMKFLVLTWGTAWVYLLKETGNVVANCHKLPDKFFERKLLGVDEILRSAGQILEKLEISHPGLQVILTISPVRHLKDGLAENQVSKSTLLLAARRLSLEYKNVHYFPAYEIMMDDLRDYRFYGEDMVHPNMVAIGYIMDKLRDSLIDPSAFSVMKEVEKLNKALGHRPFNPDTKEHREFLQRMLKHCEGLEKKFPFLDLTNEKTRFGMFS
jgi:hypothetical protein